MTDELIAACRALNIEIDQIVKHRHEGDDLVLLVDRGIGGITKHRMPIADIAPTLPIDNPWESVDEPPVALDALSYNELREMAKDRGVTSASRRKADLIDALTADEEE